MKRILFVLLVLGAAMSSQAQHTLQIDDGAGRYGIIQSNPLWPMGVTIFDLPPTGGTLVVAPPPGVPALMWLTDAAGNTLTDAGGGSTDPVERFGSDNFFDVVMMADGSEKMRMIAGGGVSITNADLAIGGLSYVWPGLHGAGTRVLSNDGLGNLSWTNGFVTSITGTANRVLANGTSGIAQTGPVILTGPQDIHTGASPTFVGATLTGLTASRNVRTNGSSALTTGPIAIDGGANEVTGILPIANGGTNSGTALVNGRVMRSTGGAIVENAAGTANQLLHGDLAWGAVVLTSQVSGILPIANGGTNSGTALVNGRVMTSVGGAIVENASGTANQVLHGNLGWSAVSLTADVSGILPIANGGTNSGTALNGNRIMVSNAGATAIVEAAALTNGQLLIGSTGAAPVAAAITGTANRVTVANGAGSITLSGPQDIHTGASPTFVGLTLSGLTASRNVRTGVGGVLTTGAIALDGGATEVTGILPIANGGTNSGTALSGSTIMISNGTQVVQGAAGTTTTVLHGNAGGAPTYGAVVLTSDVSGILPVANGGTNSGTALNNNRIMVSNTGAIVEAAALTNGQLLIGSTGAAPVAATIAATANQTTVTNGAGTITIGTVQNINTTSSPSFTGLTVSGLTANSNVRTGVGGVLTTGPIALGGGVTEVTGILPDANIDAAIARDNEGPAAGDVSGSLTLGYSVNSVQSGAVDLTTDVTGILPAVNGGTGLDGSAAANGALLIGNGAGFTLANITGTANQVTVTDGAGTITLSGPQDLAPASSPSFFDVTITNPALQNRFAFINGTGNVTAFGPASPTVSSFANALTGELGTANGGTGLDGSGASAGQLLIGNGAGGFTLGTLTQGSGITITNGPGAAITIAATGSLSGSGVANRVAFWDGASSLNNNAGFTYDGTTLGVSSSTAATSALSVSNSSATGTAATLAAPTGGGVALALASGKMTVSIETLPMTLNADGTTITIPGNAVLCVITDNGENGTDKTIIYPSGTDGQILIILNNDINDKANTGGGAFGPNLDNSAKEIGMFMYYSGVWHRVD